MTGERQCDCMNMACPDCIEWDMGTKIEQLTAEISTELRNELGKWRAAHVQEREKAHGRETRLRAEVERLTLEAVDLRASLLGAAAVATMDKAQLAERERVLQEVQGLVDNAPELNLDNYDLGQVDELNQAVIDIHHALAAKPAEACHPACEIVHNIECPNGSPMKHNAQREAKPAEVCECGHSQWQHIDNKNVCLGGLCRCGSYRPTQEVEG